MKVFTAKGGWWVVGQGVLLAALATVWLVWRGGWGVPAVAGGAVLAGLGAALAAGGMLALGSRLSPFPAPVRDGALVEGGVYRLARHPIYGGLVLGALGISLADGNWPGLLLAGGLAAFFWAKASFEERLLAQQYPAYPAYRQRVRRRLLPWVL